MHKIAISAAVRDRMTARTGKLHPFDEHPGHGPAARLEADTETLRVAG
jgi:hypothetical protein